MKELFVVNDPTQPAWNCIPPKESDNENAIFFVITDDYSFAAANMIMSLYKHSSELMEKTDVIIYHDGISEKNAQLLKNLHQNTLFMQMTFPESWRPLVEHPRTEKWGYFIIAKLFGLYLIQKYKKVLLLDVDMLVTGDISELFEINEAIAWRPVVAWKPQTVFSSILDPMDSDISAGNGGLWLFGNALKEYEIGVETISTAFDAIKDLRPGGIDELTMAWIAYTNKMSIKELDVCFYNTPVQTNKPESKLIHFLDYKKVCTKPWKNPVSFFYFSDWAENYRKWIEIGGDEAISFSREDYFKMFGFDKAKEIDDLKKKVKKLSDNSLRELQKENKKLREELEKLKNSTSWKITKPLRWLAAKFRKFKKKVKSCLKN